MKMKLLVDGNDGTKAYKAGDTYTGDSEWARRVLVNGLAEPLDDTAKAIAGSNNQLERYGDVTLGAIAETL